MPYLDRFNKTKTFDTEEDKIHLLPMDKIKADEQVRKHIDEEKLKELADSIRERGLQQPIKVRLTGTEESPEYTIILGERRWRAHQQLGQTQIKAIIVTENQNNDDITVDQLVENIQRADLNVIEKARGFEALKNMKKNQREIARSLGIRETDVSKHLAILKKIPANWIAKIEECCQKTTIPFYRIHEIAQAKNKQKQKAMCEKLLEEVGQLDEEIEDVKEDINKETKKKGEKEYDVEEVWEAFKWISRKDRTKLVDIIPAKTLDKILELYAER